MSSAVGWDDETHPSKHFSIYNMAPTRIQGTLTKFILPSDYYEKLSIQSPIFQGFVQMDSKSETLSLQFLELEKEVAE